MSFTGHLNVFQIASAQHMTELHGEIERIQEVLGDVPLVGERLGHLTVVAYTTQEDCL